jgi:lipopolysaccharide/colanic/teichoic acid biosynthesis glycosyltransferase
MSRWLPLRWWVDRALAFALQLPGLPLLAVIAALVRRHDGGPALVRVPRVGKDGRPFGMWKVRTMTAAGPDGLSAGPEVTSADDDRVTAIGRRLRQLRLDELPQLLNVAAGEMALVGPRPESPRFVPNGDAAWRRVLRAKPGIAGPTQLLVHDWEAAVLSGPTAESTYRDVILPVKLAIDAWYVERSSPWIDWLVVTSLARRFLTGRPPDRLSRRVRREVPAAMAVPSPRERERSGPLWAEAG